MLRFRCSKSAPVFSVKNPATIIYQSITMTLRVVYQSLKTKQSVTGVSLELIQLISINPVLSRTSNNTENISLSMIMQSSPLTFHFYSIFFSVYKYFSPINFIVHCKPSHESKNARKISPVVTLNIMSYY